MNFLYEFIKKEVSNLIFEAEKKITPEIIKLLGTMPDPKLSAISGIGTSSLGKMRRKLNIPMHGHIKKIPQPPEELISALGKVSDRKLARRYGVNPATIERMRKDAGINPFNVYNAKKFTPEMIEALGTISDIDFSNKYNVSLNIVSREREKRGIQTLKDDIIPKNESEKQLIKYLRITRKLNKQNTLLYLMLSDNAQRGKLKNTLLKPTLSIDNVYVYHEVKDYNLPDQFTVFIVFDKKLWSLFPDELNFEHFDKDISPSMQLTIMPDSVNCIMIIFTEYQDRAKKIDVGNIKYEYTDMNSFYKLILNFILRMQKSAQRLSDELDRANLKQTLKTGARPNLSLSQSRLAMIDKEF